MPGYQDEIFQQKLRLDFNEVFSRVSPGRSTLQVRAEILRRVTDRTVASASVSSASGATLTFKVPKDSGAAQIVGTRRDQLDFDNLNNDLEYFTIQALVTRHMVACLPTDKSLGDYSGTSWPVAAVEKTGWLSDAAFTSDQVALSDHQGAALTDLPPALAGKTVVFKDTLKIDPSAYNLYVLNEGTLLFDLIPRPTGVDATDQYRLDCVTGIITLRAPWIAARPDYAWYCFRLNMARMARSNETMQEHIEEPREILEEIKGAKMTLGRDEMALTAVRVFANKHFYDVDDPPTTISRRPAWDWWKLSDPIIIGTSGPGGHGFALDTGFSFDNAIIGYGAQASVNLPLLTIVDEAFLSIPADWIIFSAALRFKATLGASTRYWRDPIGVVNSDLSYNPDFGCGWVHETLGNTFCQNLDRNLDDDALDPRCRLRGPSPSGPSNVELYRRADDNDHCGSFLTALTDTGTATPIEIIDSVDPQYIWNQYENANGGWSHNCRYGPDQIPVRGPILQPRSQGHFFFGPDGSGNYTRRTGYATESAWMEDFCYRKTGALEPKANNGIACSFAHFMKYSMPRGRSTSSHKADGAFHIMDVTDTLQDIHARKNSIPGTCALVLAPKEITDFYIALGATGDHGWAPVMTQVRDITAFPPGGDTATMYGWQPNRVAVEFEIAAAELYVEIQTPDGFIAPLAPSMQLAGLDAPA